MFMLMMILALGGVGLLIPLLFVGWRRRSRRRMVWGPYPVRPHGPWRRVAPIRVRRIHGPHGRRW